MDRFVTTVLRDVSGCPNPVIKEEVLSSAIEFCERSEVYTTTLTETVEVDDETLSMTAPDDTAIVEINKVEIDDCDYYEYEHDDGVITFDEDATADETWYIDVSLKPLRTVTELPDTLYNNWYQAISAGAKAKLMAMPGKPWTNPKLAQIHSSIFETGVNKAMNKALAKTMPTARRIERNQWL